MEQQQLLNHLQNIAIQGAAISRFFWPIDKRYASRGAYMRECFKLDDSSPLKSRDLRNRMEHYDEYLDDYFSRQDVFGNILPDYIGKEPSEEEMLGFHIFRAYFVDTGRVSILGVKYELQPLVDEISRLHNILVDCENEGSKFPR